MSFVSQSLFEVDEFSAWRLDAWEQCFENSNAVEAQELIRNTDASGREVLAALSDWMATDQGGKPAAKRHFFNVVVGVHPQDHEAHAQLEQILAEIQTGTCEVKPFPAADVGTWLVVNQRNQPIAVFKAGERRAFMEITARRVAFMMGLQRWVVPATIAAVEEIKVPLPPYDRLPVTGCEAEQADRSLEASSSSCPPANNWDIVGPQADEPAVAENRAKGVDRVDVEETESDQSEWSSGECATEELDDEVSDQAADDLLGRLRVWGPGDLRSVHLVEELSVETFSGHRKVYHPDRADPRRDLPQGETTGAIVGVLMPYLRERECDSIEDYDASFIGLTATACVLGLGDAKADGIIDDRIVDAEMLMPSYLEPPHASSQPGGRVRCVASCSIAYQQAKLSRSAERTARLAGEVNPVTMRGRRVGAFSAELCKAIDQWDAAIDKVLADLIEARPVFFDRQLESLPAVNAFAEDPILRLDANGMAYHLETLGANPGQTPSVHADQPAFNSEQLLAFHQRAEAVRSAYRVRRARAQLFREKALIEPMKLVAEVDPVAREQLLQYEIVRYMSEQGSASAAPPFLEAGVAAMLSRAPLTIGTVGSPIGWSQPWEEAIARSASVDSASPAASLTPTLRATLEEVLALLADGPSAALKEGNSPRGSSTGWLDSPIFSPQAAEGMRPGGVASLFGPAVLPEGIEEISPLVEPAGALLKPAAISLAESVVSFSQSGRKEENGFSSRTSPGCRGLVTAAAEKGSI